MSVIKAAEPRAIETIVPNAGQGCDTRRTHVLGEHEPEPFIPLFGPETATAQEASPAAAPPPTNAGCSQSADASSSEPSVELVREGDDVRAIVVHCRCGERIRLDCEF